MLRLCGTAHWTLLVWSLSPNRMYWVVVVRGAMQGIAGGEGNDKVRVLRPAVNHRAHKKSRRQK